MEEKKKQNRDKINEKRWRKENTTAVTINLLKTTDADIISFLDKEIAKGKSKQGVFKEALREKIEREEKREN